MVIRTQLMALQLVEIETETVYIPELKNPTRMYVSGIGMNTNRPTPVYAQNPVQATFWSLTPRGLRLFLEKKAIRKAVQDNESESPG